MSCEQGEGPKVTLDEQGRVASVAYIHARKVREFSYDADGQIVRVVVRDEMDGTVRVFIRQWGSLWLVCNEIGKKLGEWRGEVAVETDGTYLIRAERRTGASKTTRYFA